MFISTRRLDDLLKYIKSKNNGLLPWEETRF